MVGTSRSKLERIDREPEQGPMMMDSNEAPTNMDRRNDDLVPMADEKFLAVTSKVTNFELNWNYDE